MNFFFFKISVLFLEKRKNYLYNRHFSTTIFSYQEEGILDSEIIEMPEGEVPQPLHIYQGAHFYLLNFNYSSEHLIHRRELHECFLNRGFWSQFNSHVSFFLGLYWYFEYLLSNMEETLDLFSVPEKERGLLRLVIRFLQNEVLKKLQRMGYVSISIDIPCLLKDTQNLSYHILTECVNNDIYCYMNILRQCIGIERLCNRDSISHSIRIDYGDYLLLFDFDPQIMDTVCGIMNLDVLGIYYIETKKGWLHKMFRHFVRHTM